MFITIQHLLFLSQKNKTKLSKVSACSNNIYLNKFSRQYESRRQQYTFTTVSNPNNVISHRCSLCQKTRQTVFAQKSRTEFLIGVFFESMTYTSLLTVEQRLTEFCIQAICLVYRLAQLNAPLLRPLCCRSVLICVEVVGRSSSKQKILTGSDLFIFPAYFWINWRPSSNDDENHHKRHRLSFVQEKINITCFTCLYA